MSIPRPKFCVGEVVDGIRGDGVTVPGEEVMKMTFDFILNVETGEIFETWQYKTPCNINLGEKWWGEYQLRKRPQNNWKDCVWKPEEVTA